MLSDHHFNGGQIETHGFAHHTTNKLGEKLIKHENIFTKQDKKNQKCDYDKI